MKKTGITRKQAIKKMGKYAALTAIGTFAILNPKLRHNLHLQDLLDGINYFSKIWLKSLNDLNSSAFPAGSLKNIVACSPASPLNLM